MAQNMNEPAIHTYSKQVVIVDLPHKTCETILFSHSEAIMKNVSAKCSSPILPDVLLDYFSHRLGPEQEGAIEVHLAQCDFCAELAWQAHSFAVCIPTWNAAGHREAYAESQSRFLAELRSEKVGTRAFARLVHQISDALNILEQNEQIEAVKNRLCHWRKALEIDLAAIAKDLARVAAASRSNGFGVLEVLQRCGWSWESMSPVPAFRPLSTSLIELDREVQAAQTVVWKSTRGIRHLRVVLRRIPDNSREIEIRLTGLPTECESILILLLSADASAAPRWADLTKTRIGVWAARVSDIETDEITVVLPPLELGFPDSPDAVHGDGSVSN
jgi:hypothetical protein